MRSRKRTILKIVLAGAIGFAAVIAIASIRQFYTTNQNIEHVSANELQVGDTAPDFTVNLLSGGTFTLSENKGKVVFLNFWGTWCAPCIEEMPAIQALSEKYTDDVVFIGMDYGDNNINKVQDFIAGKGFTYPIGLDESGDIKNLYPALGVPYTLVIDAEGIISWALTGGSDQMYDVFDDAIAEALNK
ncbi:MAG TPA: TlpA family protein disulfide reductase [Clostridiales bacterium]|nr:TlpA family protein disulfide reductase [Clostridiales bacterium]